VFANSTAALQAIAAEGGLYGERDSVAVSFLQPMSRKFVLTNYLEKNMQTEIEILEPRENPAIIWT
jgi:hypothetical protein